MLQKISGFGKKRNSLQKQTIPYTLQGSSPLLTLWLRLSLRACFTAGFFMSCYERFKTGNLFLCLLLYFSSVLVKLQKTLEEVRFFQAFIPGHRVIIKLLQAKGDILPDRSAEAFQARVVLSSHLIIPFFFLLLF